MAEPSTARVHALPPGNPTIVAEAISIMNALHRGDIAFDSLDANAAVRDIAAMAKRWFRGGHRDDPWHTIQVLESLVVRLGKYPTQSRAIAWRKQLLGAIADICERTLG